MRALQACTRQVSAAGVFRGGLHRQQQRFGAVEGIPSRPEEGAAGVQVAATLSLGRLNRKEGQDMFSREVAGSRSFLSARMRATLSNISEPEDYQTLLSYIIPGGLPNKISDEEAKSKLNEIYRDNPDQLSVIERAYHASGRQDILPIPMENENVNENEE